ncbi:MAG: VOC family protein [Christensenellaceae bacterium]|nr:VOC family protein [Christensenellaceae bacterium]
MKTNVLGLAHIGLYIKDLEVTKKFYTEILGFEIISHAQQEDGTLIAFARKGCCELELVQLPVWEDRPDGLFDHVAMEVEDIYAAYEEVKAKGVEFESEIVTAPHIHGGVRYVMFRGPDGEHLEFEQYGL